MSSSKPLRKTKSAPARGKSAAQNNVRIKSSTAERSPAEKAAFAKAMYRGIQPGTSAARSVARKKARVVEAEPAVEVLRKIPAPQPRADNEESAYILQLASDIDQAIKDGNLQKFSPQAQQALIGAMCRLYSASNEGDNQFGALGPQSGVSATDAMMLCGALLKGVDLQVFELGLWLSWSSR